MKIRCAFCKEYVLREDAFRTGVVSFCNKEHFYAWQNKPKEPKPQSARSVSKPQKKKDEPLKAVRDHVAEGDNHRCRWCGTTNGVEQHHIFYRSESKNGPWKHETSNLISLCTSHHQTVHSNKRRYKPILLGVVWMREVHGSSISIPEFEKQYPGG